MKYLTKIIGVGAVLTFIGMGAITVVNAPVSSSKKIITASDGSIAKANLIQAGLSQSLSPAEGFEEFGKAEGDRSFHSDMLYGEIVLSYGPVEDPRPIFLLANSYIVSNQQKYGIAFFEKLLKRYENHFSADVKANYLAAYAILRATYADNVFLLNRIGWVNDTFDILEEASVLSGGSNPLVKWASGLIYAQVPWFFGKEEEALRELTWLADHPETEPEPGFYREVYHHLAKIYENSRDEEKARNFLIKSGYKDYVPQTLIMGWFSSSKETGLLFSPTPWIEEVVPGKVFAVRGFGFSELHFIVSEDGQELISIDAGTQPFSMEAGYEYLLENFPNLPPLTTAFFTHAHWDHIGGHSFLKTLNPKIIFYGRENYHGTVDRALRNHTYEQFRSESYSHDWINSYHPDRAISERTSVQIGGTEFDLIPVTGGETEDAMLINMPAEQVVFVGDVLMPFYGEPWVEEGFIPEAIDTMDAIIAVKPKHILHGHYGINVLYNSAEVIVAYRNAYSWLVEETTRHLEAGYSVKDIVRLNLIPPSLRNNPETIIGFQAPRNHIIARLGDHMLGIWQEGITGKEPSGLDNLTSIEYGRLLELYLRLSAGEVEDALRVIIDGGDNELALKLAVAAEGRYEENAGIILLKEEAADRARGALQFFDPFGFVTYTEMIEKSMPQITVE
ncbi:MBL fold metallo-hydrolase [Kiloniella litopenaei]|uniref:MBL fold metallo-hydrolase n=1 Tax=Kiloniella litopenaei TaxID=1549748 RepID=UPI003BA87AFE